MKADSLTLVNSLGSPPSIISLMHFPFGNALSWSPFCIFDLWVPLGFFFPSFPLSTHPLPHTAPHIAPDFGITSFSLTSLIACVYPQNEPPDLNILYFSNGSRSFEVIPQQMTSIHTYQEIQSRPPKRQARFPSYTFLQKIPSFS